MILKKREKLILYFTIGIIMFSVLLNFLIMPVLNKYNTLDREVMANDIKLKKYLRLLSQKEQIQEKYNKFSANIQFSAETKDVLVSALRTIEGLAKNADVKIVDIRPQSSQKDKNQILIEIRTEATMGNHCKFIYNIENSLSLLTIRSFQLAAKPGSPALEGNFSISQPTISKEK